MKSGSVRKVTDGMVALVTMYPAPKARQPNRPWLSKKMSARSCIVLPQKPVLRNSAKNASPKYPLQCQRVAFPLMSTSLMKKNPTPTTTKNNALAGSMGISNTDRIG